MTAEELLERFAAGERDFQGLKMYTGNLGGAVLSGINFSKAYIGCNLS